MQDATATDFMSRSANCRCTEIANQLEKVMLR